MSRARDWLVLIGFLALTFGAAWTGNVATSESVRDWYPSLRKPAGTPPSWVFGPVWTVLYFLMAVGAWLVWRCSARPRARRVALILFFVQLAFNVLWSVIFFALRSPGAAMVEMLVLWTLIAATQRKFWKVSTLAGLLLAPYLAWVTYAAYLNFGIWRLNLHGTAV